MPNTFERVRMATAVVAAAVILVLSTVAGHDWTRFIPEPTAREDIEAVKRGVAILERGGSPLVDMQPCDAVKSLLPDRFTREDGDTNMKVRTDKDVIVCFRDDIDYGEALASAAERGLTWERGLGGDKILVFAPSEARFLAVARMNGLTLGPGDLQNPDLLMKRLQGHERASRIGKQWLIAPGSYEDEVLFGPYADLSPGAYSVVLGLEPQTPIGCTDALPNIRVDMAVSADARATTLLPRQMLSLKPGVAADGRCLLTGELTFSVATAAKAVETPVWVHSALLPLRVVRYDIAPAT
jgi:hypothetical protein